jgi:signal transduction histidine kinase
VDANVVVQDVLSALEGQIEGSGARVTVERLPVLRVHRTHLFQIFQNLVSNAVKYHRPDRLPVVHIGSEVREHGIIELYIEDNGIGIASEYHERIFGIFRRLHGASVPGTGIGLAICKRIVEQYEGKIWVDSTPGIGSTFHSPFPRDSCSTIRGNIKRCHSNLRRRT